MRRAPADISAMLLTDVARRERSWETRTSEPGKEARYFPSQSLALESS